VPATCTRRARDKRAAVRHSGGKGARAKGRKAQGARAILALLCDRVVNMREHWRTPPTAAIGPRKALMSSAALFSACSPSSIFSIISIATSSRRWWRVEAFRLALTDTQRDVVGFPDRLRRDRADFRHLGDRMSRRVSSHSRRLLEHRGALSGFAWNFTSLFVARASVCVGEGRLRHHRPESVVGLFSAQPAGCVMAIFFCAIPVARPWVTSSAG